MEDEKRRRRYIMDLNTSGQWMLFDIQGWIADAVYLDFTGTHEEDLGFTGRLQRQRHKGEMPFISTNDLWN